MRALLIERERSQGGMHRAAVLPVRRRRVVALPEREEKHVQFRIPWLERIGITEVTRQTFRQARDDDVLTYAASLAFHIFLALFPF